MGIRMALGAQPMGIVYLMTRKGLVFVFLGLILGAVGALLMQRSMSGLFAGTQHGMSMYFGAAATLLAISTASIFFPAYLATRCEPSRNLHD